jgi:hypothetical protein
MNLNKIIQIIQEEVSNFNNNDYLKWKRANVTLRGMSVEGDIENGAGAMLGQGLYTAFLSNRAMAKQYGDVYFVVGAIPKHPKVFNTLNDWEIWRGNTLIYNYSKVNGINHSDMRYFDEHTSISAELQKMGYDGIVIKGREMVNFTPSDNIHYFRTEQQLENWYDFLMDNR